jgi:hypothetical protein
MKAMVTPPGTKLLKLKRDILLSTSAFKFSLRRYTLVPVHRAAAPHAAHRAVQPGGAVQVDPFKPTLKAPRTMRLKLKYVKTAFKPCFQIQLAPLQPGRHGGGRACRILLATSSNAL